MVDFTKQHELRAYIMETTGGPAAGGLTVRDVFACSAMAALIEKFDESCHEVSTEAYEFADAMLEARITLPPKQDVSLEEAFGFEKPEPGKWVEVSK